MAYSSVMTTPSSAPSCADHSKVPWILPVAPSRSPATVVVTVTRLPEGDPCARLGLPVWRSRLRRRGRERRRRDRLLTALPSALEGAGRACGVTHEAADGNRKPK